MDVEITPNFFSVTFVDLQDYLIKCKNEEVSPKGKVTVIPLTVNKKVSEIKRILDSVAFKQFYITDRDDSMLLELIAYINSFRAVIDEVSDGNGGTMQKLRYRTDVYSFNGIGYDDLMIACLLGYYNRFNNTAALIKHLYNTSKSIIALQNNKDGFTLSYKFNSRYKYNNDGFYNDPNITLLRKYKLPYVTVDVMKVFALDKVMKSLKQTSINLQWHELLDFELPALEEDERIYYIHRGSHYKTMPIEEMNDLVDTWDRYILDRHIPEFLYYNKNDVFIGCEIVRQKIEDIRTRYNSSNEYGINLLSSSRSNIADKLISKFYAQYTGLHYKAFSDLRTIRTALGFKKIIFDYIKFDTPQLQEFLADMKTITIYKTSKDEFSREFEFYGTKYTIAVGGIHSIDLPRVLISKRDGKRPFKFVHFDITSFYPSIMIVNKICPKHLNVNAFIKLLTWIRDTRIHEKHNGSAVVAEILKIVINAIYGKLGKFSMLN